MQHQEDLWYKNAVLYALDVDRFMDSDGDGIGDFEGLISRLDYLADLGITCIWLLPFYPAPGRDNGYDIMNYFGVDPALGTLDQFIHFVRRAGERGIRVVLDLVMNHTSNRHPWFEASRRDAGSRFRSYYTWTEAPPPTPPGHGTIFPGEEDSVWTFDEVAGAYYYHRFYHFQPELDMTNPDVLEEVRRVLDFWLSFGVSGFRVDAASHMIEANGIASSKPADPHSILQDLRAHVAGRRQDAVLLGEADVEPERLVAYFGDADELTMLFNFMLNNYIYLSLAREDSAPITEVLRQLPAIPVASQWANFLRNLDEVDLERLTDEQRAEVFEAFAPDENMQIFGRGIRRRVAPMVGDDPRRLRMAYSLLFALPGTPTIVYGDEIGMGEDLSQEGRKAVRAPMQWSAKKNGGFSTAAKKDLVQAAIEDDEYGYRKVNVEAQRQDPESLWNYMRKLILVRRSCPEVGLGSWHLMQTGESAVVAFRCTWKDGTVVTLHNLGGKKVSFSIDLHDQRGRRLTDLWGGHTEQICDSGQTDVELDAYGASWLRIEGSREAAVL